MSEPDSPTSPAWFETTHWSLVLAAGQETSPQGQEALEKLCRAYWKPLHTYVRSRGRTEADAADLTQEFFARLLAKDYLRLANRERGRFRTFLLSSLQNFLTNDWKSRRSARRGGGVEVDPLYEDDIAASDDSPGDELRFDREWAEAIINQALTQLRAEYDASRKSELLEKLKCFIGAGPLNVGSQESFASELGLTPGALRVAVHRLRDRYRDLLRAAVAHTVASPAEVDDELRYLIRLLRAS